MRQSHSSLSESEIYFARRLGLNHRCLIANLRSLAIREWVSANIGTAAWLRIRFLHIQIANFGLKPSGFFSIFGHIKLRI
jgi:hypothetical protein